MQLAGTEVMHPPWRMENVLAFREHLTIQPEVGLRGLHPKGTKAPVHTDPWIRAFMAATCVIQRAHRPWRSR